ncbi:MAG: hypothetical protein FJ224_05695 [Lentisphaerae bacterium]|nr:hypothetical protein [Lentisphaerota bacterium]
MRRSVNAGKKRVQLSLAAQPGSQVFVAGTFNDWDPLKKSLKDDGSGIFKTTMFVAPGRYEYKFVVDGQWCLDPECSEWAPNPHGSLNSVLIVE